MRAYGGGGGGGAGHAGGGEVGTGGPEIVAVRLDHRCCDRLPLGLLVETYAGLNTGGEATVGV